MPIFYTKQPDGKYAVWSSVVDDFVLTDATRKEIIKWRITRSIEEIKQDLNKTLDVLDEDGHGTPLNIWPWWSLQEHIAKLKEIKEQHL